MIRRSPIAVTLALLVAGCSASPEEAVIDLLAELPYVEHHAESRRIDLGDPASRAALGSGWSWDERSGEMSFVWSDGARSELDLFLLAPKPIELSFRCFAAPDPLENRKQTMRIGVNGIEVDSVTVDPRPTVHRVTLPAAALRTGSNRLQFDYAWTAAPASSDARSQRRLAVGWDWLSVATGSAPSPGPVVNRAAGTLSLPAGSRTDVFVELPADARLELDELHGQDGATQVEVSLAVGSEEPRLLRSSSGERRLRLEFGPSAAGTPVRLSFAVSGDSGAVLVAPRIVARRDGASLPPPLPTTAIADRHSVVLYVIDTLRADRLGVYGGGPSLSPRIDAFAADGVIIENAIAASSWTKPTVASLLTGLGPLTHGVHHRDHRLRAEIATLPELLAAAGYATAGFAGNPYFQPDSGLRQGFDRFELGPDRDGALQRRALEWLGSLPPETPFFLYLHTVEPHAPYDPPQAERRAFAGGVEQPVGSTEQIRALARGEQPRTPEVEDGLRRLYDAEVAYADRRFGEFLDGLDGLGLGESTTIVLTADHGEEVFEHQVVGHGWNLFDPVLSVPLILRPPAGRGNVRRIGEPTHQIDLVPTLLELAGVRSPVAVEGRSLAGRLLGQVEPLPEVPSISYMDYAGRRGVSVVLGDWKLVYPLTSNFLPRSELYDRGSDPGETVDRSSDRPVLAGYLRTVARKALAAASDVEAPTETLSAEAEAALEALGYLN